MNASQMIREALTTILKVDPGELDNDTNLVEDGYVDSLDSLRLLFLIEKRLGRKLYEDHEVSAESFKVSELKARIDG